MKKIIIVLAFLFVAGAAIEAWREGRRVQYAADAKANVANERARTITAIRAMEQRLTSAERACAARLSELNEMLKTSTSASTTVPASDVAALFKKYREREKDPKVQAIRIASWRAQVMTSHGPLFRKLGLTPVQIGQFQDTVARRDEQKVDLNAILDAEAEANGSVSVETRAAVEKLKDQVKLQSETAQRELLGDEGFRTLSEYNRTVGARRAVSDLAGAAAVLGIPFTAEQAEQLTRVLANASDTYREGGAANAANLDWKLADEQARGILSAPQMTFFQTVASPLSSENRFQRQMRDALAEAAKADAESKQTVGAPAGGG